MARLTRLLGERQPMSRRQRLIGWAVAAALFTVAIIAVSRQGDQAAASFEDRIPRDAAGAVTAEARSGIGFARAGDCLLSVPGNDDVVHEVTFMPCDQPHRVSVLGWTFADETGTQEAAKAATAECIARAIAITGVNPQDLRAEYKLTIVPPMDEATGYLCLADYAATGYAPPPTPASPSPTPTR